MVKPKLTFFQMKIKSVFQVCLKGLDFSLRGISIKTVNIIFALGAVVVLYFHVLFAVGLYDGSHDLIEMIFSHRVLILEISRLFFEFGQQAPTLFFIEKFSSSSLLFLVQLFSFGLVWIHAFSLIGCYFILPKNKKNMIFFPLLGFWTGSVISLHLSISVGLSACSYIWLVAYIIYYSDLSNKIQKAFFFIAPLPLILSYESMSYMAWPLIALCGYRRKEKQRGGALWFVQLCLIIVSIVQIVMTVFHDRITNSSYADNLASVIREIIYFDFLFKPSFNFLLVLALLILFYCFIQIYKDSYKIKFNLQFIEYLIFLIFIFILIASCFQIKNNFIFDYSIRHYPPALALPLSLFLWWICETRKIDMEKWRWKRGNKLFLLSKLIFILIFCFFRVYFDWSFFKFQMRVSKYLHSHKGVVSLEQIRHSFKDAPFDSALISWYGLTVKLAYISLLYPRSRDVNAVVSKNRIETCIKCCKRPTSCKKIDSLNCRGLFYVMEEANKTRFFDTSEVMNSYSHHLAGCR